MGFLLFVTSKECKAEKWQINRPAAPNGRIALRSDATGGPGNRTRNRRTKLETGDRTVMALGLQTDPVTDD